MTMLIFEDIEAASDPEEVTVVHLNDCGGKKTQLLSEFLNGTTEEVVSEDTRYSNES